LAVIFEIRLTFGGRLACKYESRRVARLQRFEKKDLFGNLDWEWEVARQGRDRHFLSNHHQ
jgi:hypothetical protein